MNPLKFFTLWITSMYFHYIAATNTWTKIDLTDYKHPALIVDLPNERYGTACPSSTEREIKFNEEVSVSGKGLFLRNIYYKNETIVLSICDEPFEPVMLYNLKTRKYDIGYELYYEQSTIQLDESEYFQYRSVSINNEIINATKTLSQYVVDSQASNGTKFQFTDGSPTLIFHWISKLSFTYSAHTKQIKVLEENIPLEEGASIKCPSNGLSEQDTRVYLTSEGDENHFELWKDQNSYGALEMSQIIPVRFFTEPSSILASCSHMNLVPIWKTIADGQLKKVDLSLQSLITTINRKNDMGGLLWRINDLSFGVTDVLEEPISKQKMYFSDINHRRQIAIPKIIYRMIEGNQNHGVCNAIIVIHNDPTNVSDSDRICAKEDEVPGWENIKNDDPRTGLTYVCHYCLKIVSPSNKLNLDLEHLLSKPLRLDKVPYAYSIDTFLPIEMVEFNQTYFV